MGEVIQCDACGKLAHESDSVGWLKLERIGVDARSYGEPPGPWHFDSRDCLRRYAEKKL